MIHSFEPVIDNDCEILILGTMPGVQSLKKQQYYGNKQNVFWKIIYSLFDEDMSDDYEERKEFLLRNHIALWDVLKACDREGSLDSDIKNPIPNDFENLFKCHTRIKHVYFNGTPAQILFKRYVMKKIDVNGLEFFILPSTSPANTMKYEKKLEKWREIMGTIISRQ